MFNYSSHRNIRNQGVTAFAKDDINCDCVSDNVYLTGFKTSDEKEGMVNGFCYKGTKAINRPLRIWEKLS